MVRDLGIHFQGKVDEATLKNIVHIIKLDYSNVRAYIVTDNNSTINNNLLFLVDGFPS